VWFGEILQATNIVFVFYKFDVLAEKFLVLVYLSCQRSLTFVVIKLVEIQTPEE